MRAFVPARMGHGLGVGRLGTGRKKGEGSMFHLVNKTPEGLEILYSHADVRKVNALLRKIQGMANGRNWYQLPEIWNADDLERAQKKVENVKNHKN